MKSLERVMDVRKLRKPGQYFMERNWVSEDKDSRTIRKTNSKMLVYMCGKCPVCGNAFFSEYDPENKEPMPCATKECTTKFQFIDGGLQYEEGTYEKPKDKAEETIAPESVEVVVNQPQDQDSAK